MREVYKNITILFSITCSIFFSSVTFASSDEIKMRCITENILSNNYTYFKYKSSFFSKKVLYRDNGNWIDLSQNSNLQEYKMGDLSSSFLVRKRDDWWFSIVLDFETKEILIKNCYNRNCSGTLIAKGSETCS